MLLKRESMKGILIIVLLFLITPRLSAQTEEIDTSGYIPYFYYGALEYNLMLAASKGYDYEVVRLIKKGADIDASTTEGATPLVFAVANNHLSTVRTLIRYNASVDPITVAYETPFLIAIKNQNIEIAEPLLRAGADINFADHNGVTALHFASYYGYFYVTDFLIFYDAIIDKNSNDGTTPLMAAVWAGYADIADLLIQHGANIDAGDNMNFTPFLIASQQGDTLMMNLLIKSGVNIYEKNIYNWDALSLSIRMSHLPATELLLKTGDQWTSPERNAIDPYSVASKYRRKEIIEILVRENVPGKIVKGFDQAGISVSTKFTGKDVYTGFSMSFKEPFYNGGFLAGIDTKLWYTRVLLKQDESNYYQYLDKSSLIYMGFFKDISLTDNQSGGNFAFNGSLSAAYSFGNKLKGTNITPGNKFMVVPSAGFKWFNNHLALTANAEYMKSDYYNIGPLWLRVGLTYNYFFDKIRAPGKIINWY